MAPHYCSKGHENPPGSRFCLQCGEKLDNTMNKSIQSGQTLGDRYLIVRQLGQGGFGRTYLAEDSNRFNELCVLKEFSPQVQTAYVLEKAEELFEREAGVLYKLQHPQIPRFRELLRLNVDGKGYLFLVQDYVEGETYRSALETRKLRGMRFTEAEVRQLLQQILPVLEYVHSMGVIHRDISPDNLILRNYDQLPILIDFGGVKQVAATVASQFYQPGAAMPAGQATLLGKIGYAPPEQMQTGMVYPHSDLYALAVTLLVLLTAKEPQELIDNHTLSWNWRREVNLSPALGAVLDRMLSQLPGDRYQSARQVLQALNPQPSHNYPPTQPPDNLEPTSATVAVAPAYAASRQGNPPPTPPAYARANPAPPVPALPQPRSWFTPGKIALVALLLTGAAVIGWWGGNSWLESRSNVTTPDEVIPEPIDSQSPTPTPTQTEEPPPAPQFSAAERQRKERLRDRREQLGLDYNFYVNAVNQLFWNSNPSQNGKSLSDSPADEQLRAEWDKTAAELLNRLEQANLSSAARRRLGNYRGSDIQRFTAAVNNSKLSTRALYDLTDVKYSSSLSDYSAKKLNLSFGEFLGKPIGQIWYAIADDKVRDIQSGTALERVVFDAGATGKTVNGTLKPGEGKAFIAGLAQAQIMQANLSGNEKILFSIYPPTSNIPALLQDSAEKSWSGTLPANGFYEFVVVSTASEPVDYQLSITAENSAPPSPEPTPTDTPTPTPEPTDEVSP